MQLSVACVQFTSKKADVPANLDFIAESLIQASSEGADLVVFPEAAMSGYLLEGGVLENSLEPAEVECEMRSRLKGLKRPIDAFFGFYEKGGASVYNSAIYLEFPPGESKTIGVYRKFFLPTYGVFDEERFVARGHELGIFETRFGKVGALICEDIWHSILATLLAVNGCQLILVPSASPARGFSGEQIGNVDRYRRMVSAVSEEHGVFCANCHLTGFEGGKGFVGGSIVTDPFGRVIAESPVAEPNMLIASVDLDLVGVARAQLPLISDLHSAWSDVKELVARARPQ